MSPSMTRVYRLSRTTITPVNALVGAIWNTQGTSPGDLESHIHLKRSGKRVGNCLEACLGRLAADSEASTGTRQSAL